MDLTGSYEIAEPREKVWAALNDPEVLARCLAGCESLERTSDTEFDARINARIGPVKARFTGTVTLSAIDPPNGYRIDGALQGGAAGFAKGGATVTLHAVVRTFEIPARISVDEHALRAKGTFSILQSEFGIEPHKALGGALSVRDRLELRFMVEANRLTVE